MSSKISALEALSKLREAYPGEFVMIKAVLIFRPGSDKIESSFDCYTHSSSNNEGPTLDRALNAAISRAKHTQEGDSAAEIIDGISPKPK